MQVDGQVLMLLHQLVVLLLQDVVLLLQVVVLLLPVVTLLRQATVVGLRVVVASRKFIFSIGQFLDLQLKHVLVSHELVGIAAASLDFGSQIVQHCVHEDNLLLDNVGFF